MKQLLLFKLPKKAQSFKSKSLKTKKKKVTPNQRKIYNNVYRARRKEIEIKTALRTIYCGVEEFDSIKQIIQVKNLMKLGFVIQTTI